MLAARSCEVMCGWAAVSLRSLISGEAQPVAGAEDGLDDERRSGSASILRRRFLM